MVGVWLLLAGLAFVALPWYLPQNLTLMRSMGGVWAGPDAASGLWQVLRHGKPWLAWAVPGLLGAALAWRWPAGRVQGTLLAGGAGLSLLGLLVSAFAIGVTGWEFEGLNTALGALVSGQPGLGLGGALLLLALLMLLGAGIARLGYFRGDLFVAGAVVLSSALLLLFVAPPVAKALLGGFQDEAGQWSAAALAERLGQERVWGLGCLVGGVRCGVAWNTLFLALITSTGTTVMGTLIALLAERGHRRLAKPLNVLALYRP